MKALWLAGSVLLSALLLQAEDFSLKFFGDGPIALHTTLTFDGKGERLTATAKNESGAPIEHAKICIASASMKKGCLFEVWNTGVWAPGIELSWNVTTALKTTDLSHDAMIEEYETLKTPETTAAPTATATGARPLPRSAKYEFKAGQLLELNIISPADSPTDRSVVFKLQVGDVVYTSTVSADSATITSYPGQPDKKSTVEDLIAGSPVQAAIDGKTLILLTPTGKQLKTKIQQSQNPKQCTYFTVVTEDALRNIKQGLSPGDVKWFRESLERKYPKACYIEPSPSAPVVFYVTVTPDTYHGTRIEESTSTQSSPVTGTITDEDGNQSQVQGTVKTTSTSSTAVPYSVEYGIFTLAVERRDADGKFAVLQRFQQKGLYMALYGIIPLGGKGYHPLHTVIEDAAKWIESGGMTDPRQSALP